MQAAAQSSVWLHDGTSPLAKYNYGGLFPPALVQGELFVTPKEQFPVKCVLSKRGNRFVYRVTNMSQTDFITFERHKIQICYIFTRAIELPNVIGTKIAHGQWSARSRRGSSLFNESIVGWNIKLKLFIS